MTHRHDTNCAPNCVREVEVDPATHTGSYRIVTRRDYGRRPGDKPRWWPFLIIAYKAAVQVVTVLGLAWLLKRAGLGAPPEAP